ncbi:MULTISPECIES: hypothetical protein [Paenibacillus]|uniref:hypothetical protein n=1 Tax=Paenibacillus TaxID=44249 RepID=UPI00142D2638|nr:hypothetical protein [Paenibacillus rhizosphaerae]
MDKLVTERLNGYLRKIYRDIRDSNLTAAKEKVLEFEIALDELIEEIEGEGVKVNSKD